MAVHSDPQEEVTELCELWTSLKDLACVTEKHIQHHNDHELFWKRLSNANMWITQKRNLLDTRLFTFHQLYHYGITDYYGARSQVQMWYIYFLRIQKKIRDA